MNRRGFFMALAGAPVAALVPAAAGAKSGERNVTIISGDSTYLQISIDEGRTYISVFGGGGAGGAGGQR